MHQRWIVERQEAHRGETPQQFEGPRRPRKDDDDVCLLHRTHAGRFGSAYVARCRPLMLAVEEEGKNAVSNVRAGKRPPRIVTSSSYLGFSTMHIKGYRVDALSTTAFAIG